MLRSHLGPNYLEALPEFELIFRTPGFSPIDQAIQKAKNCGALVTSQTQLFFDLCPSKLIGITGTKGKGTTTKILECLLQHATEKSVFVGGNIGIPPISFLSQIEKDDNVILELSSFQLQDLKKSPHIARIKIEGPIFDDFSLNRLIYNLGVDPNVKGVILHINSPGGSVVGAESTFVALSQLSEEKPSVAVLGETATSGGYLIAVATDKIISRSNTLTGSIGVILQYPNLSKFLKNIGIDINTLRSSDLKASINFFEPPTPKAIEEHKQVIDETFLWFKGLVAEKRNLSDINLETVSQGGVFTGRKAKKLGLVDLIGGEREAIKYLEEKIDIKGIPLVDWVSSKESSSLFDLIFREGEISNLGKSFLSNSGLRLYSILF